MCTMRTERLSHAWRWNLTILTRSAGASSIRWKPPQAPESFHWMVISFRRAKPTARISSMMAESRLTRKCVETCREFFPARARPFPPQQRTRHHSLPHHQVHSHRRGIERKLRHDDDEGFVDVRTRFVYCSRGSAHKVSRNLERLRHRYALRHK